MDEEHLRLEDDKSKQEIMDMVEELDSTELEETDKYVMRELLRGDSDDLYFKTDLNMTQIRGIVKLLTVDKIMKAQSMRDKDEAQKLLDSVPQFMTGLLMKLLISKDRKGRKEFITAWIKDNADEELDQMEEWVS